MRYLISLYHFCEKLITKNRTSIFYQVRSDNEIHWMPKHKWIQSMRDHEANKSLFGGIFYEQSKRNQIESITVLPLSTLSGDKK